MGQAILPGDPPIEISLRRTGRARRISLRVSRLDGRVTLSLPDHTPTSEALAFARAKEDWLRRMLAGQVAPERPRIGGTIPVEGQPLPILAGPGRRVSLTAEGLVLPDEPERVGIRIAAWLKLLARDRLAAASDRHAAALGRRYTGLTLRDTRSRWGSCAPDGRLMYSWRLVMAPPEVLDYVAAHEVAHLAEMNHSPAFWSVVAQLFPDHKRQRAWLKQNGQHLHRWQFTAP
ncbi:M48 family metallopeptidase [Frigidibacter sp. ROC022]|uniref:M48 family metallopeptidase n=1 Tax=Frigidibacter sp. ROC022 TaxID=2971796 RepID=UPI00215A57E0|nr:SprT family zinc-dependent metalloprotease [Frigidibacter sp. ROC022]MCR8722746.1 M48 family metallopeptidase [Frigidibacter sp. ROC022]